MRYPEKESSTLEFKRTLPSNQQILKTIIGFCNQNGGKIVIGVSDDGQILGLEEKEVEKILESMDKAVFQAAMPPILPRVYVQQYGLKSVVVIEVSSGMNKPYYRKSEGMAGGTYIRLGRNTMRATQEIIDELVWQSNGINFEDLPVYKGREKDLDEKQIGSFLKERKNKAKAKVTSQLMKAYNLITSEHHQIYPTNAGVLLFGASPQRYLTEAMIICTHFKGTHGREAIATIDCEGSLFHQFEQAYEFILSRLSRSFTIKEPRREEKLEVPEVAIREALLNAIIHRNYHMLSPAKVAIYENRIEIFSPGGFPGPLNSGSLKLGITYLRNPTICKIFREAGYVEKLGTGLITIYDSYKKWNLEDPEIFEGENFVKCILPRKLKTASSSSVDEVDSILGIFDKYGEVSLIDVMEKFGISRSTATRRMNALIKTGKVERVGSTRSVKFRISS